jgi:murein DD-endopeptidase MepM/ murein hydrolase activator NlpD
LVLNYNLIRGSDGTEVVSLVNGKIIQFGLSKAMQGTILMQSLKDETLYYLAVHLDETSFKSYNLEKGKIIRPGDKIAKIGIYPNGDHLHVSVIKLRNNETAVNAGYIENRICRYPTWAYPKKMINPFDYDSDYWAGRKENEEKK